MATLSGSSVLSRVTFSHRPPGFTALSLSPLASALTLCICDSITLDTNTRKGFWVMDQLSTHVFPKACRLLGLFILSSVSGLQCNQLTCIFHENTPKEEKSVILFRIKANKWISLKITLLKSWCSNRKHSLSTTECLTILIKVYSLWVFFMLGQGSQAETKSRGTEGKLKVPATTWLLVKPPLSSSLHLN